MTKFVIALLTCTLILSVGCNSTGSSGLTETAPPSPEVSQELQAAAEKLLGSGAEVLVAGDLAKNGNRQALLVYRLDKSSPNSAHVQFLRAAVIEQHGSNWNEVLRCDEYLKNPKGFLGGTPTIPITSWQLHLAYRLPDRAIAEMDFTPLPGEKASRLSPVAVRWNARVNRYQAFDTTTKQFLGESEMLVTPRSELR